MTDVTKPGWEQITTGDIKIVCYANDTTIITESEDDLQIQLHTFHQRANLLNMKTSTDKTKPLVSAKEAISCQLVTEDEIIEHVNKLISLGVQVNANQDRLHEV